MGELQKADKHEIATQETNLISAIERMSSDPSVDIDKFERLLAMQERVLAKNAEVAYNVAMNEAQSKMRRIAADSDNNQTRSKYASYAALDRALRPIYIEHGFSLSFDTGEAPEGYMTILCYVAHSGGHSKTYRATLPADGKGAKGGDVMTKTHAAGAAMTYGMRYLLKMIFNVAIGEDDNDGNEPVEKLSEEQVANIIALLDETGSDKQKFVRYISGNMCKSLEEVPAKLYDKAVKALEAKRKAVADA